LGTKSTANQQLVEDGRNMLKMVSVKSELFLENLSRFIEPITVITKQHQRIICHLKGLCPTYASSHVFPHMINPPELPRTIFRGPVLTGLIGIGIANRVLGPGQVKAGMRLRKRQHQLSFFRKLVLDIVEEARMLTQEWSNVGSDEKAVTTPELLGKGLRSLLKTNHGLILLPKPPSNGSTSCEQRSNCFEQLSEGLKTILLT